MPEPAGPTTGAVALIAGRYELLRELTRGDEVQEWEGYDSALERRVRVRFLRQDLAQDGAAVDRFWQAARFAARGRATTGERVLDGGNDPETGCAFLICELPTSELSPPPPAPKRALRLPRESASPSPPRRIGARWLAIPVLVLVTGIAVMAIRPAVAGWLAWVNTPFGVATQPFVLPPPVVPAATPAPTAAQAAPTAAPRQNTPPPASTKPSTPAATGTPTGAGVPRRIVNTDGRGVALRDAPGGNRLPGKGYDEGVIVTAFESSGQWTRIRGSDGREGWVLSVTLAQ